MPPRKSVLVSGRDRSLNARNLTGSLRIAHRLRRNLDAAIKAQSDLAALEGKPWEPPGAVVTKAAQLTRCVVELAEEIRRSDLAAQGELEGVDMAELEAALAAKVIAGMTSAQLMELAAEKERAERESQAGREADRGLS